MAEIQLAEMTAGYAADILSWRYPAPYDYYNVTAFQSAGYFVLEPDIVFRAREPGLSVVECVRPAVAAVAALGLIDARHVGIIGHSWGGFDTAYLATHTNVFAAALVVHGRSVSEYVAQIRLKSGKSRWCYCPNSAIWRLNLYFAHGAPQIAATAAGNMSDLSRLSPPLVYRRQPL